MNSNAIRALEQFAARENHTRVPLSHVETIASLETGTLDVEVPLGKEVKRLRADYRAGKLDERTIAAVESLGFQWSPRGPVKDEARNRQIRALREQGLSLEKIGDQFGISRQRVFQIVNSK